MPPIQARDDTVSVASLGVVVGLASDAELPFGRIMTTVAPRARRYFTPAWARIIIQRNFGTMSSRQTSPRTPGHAGQAALGHRRLKS
jgi:hypothetical protein